MGCGLKLKSGVCLLGLKNRKNISLSLIIITLLLKINKKIIKKLNWVLKPSLTFLCSRSCALKRYIFHLYLFLGPVIVFIIRPRLPGNLFRRQRRLFRATRLSGAGA